MDLSGVIEQCAPAMAPHILERIINVESSFNPYAIGVVGGRLVRQPKNKAEAIATAFALDSGGWNFSMGLAQVNRYNMAKYNLDYETIFEPCHNVRVAAAIYAECLQRAERSFISDEAILAALSCYYSGNFWRGFQIEKGSHNSYVQRVMAAAPLSAADVQPVPVLPAPEEGSARSDKALQKEVKTKGEAKVSRLSTAQKRHHAKELRGN